MHALLAALLLAAGVGAEGGSAPFATAITGQRLPEQSDVSSDSQGSIAVWDKKGHRIGVWSASGKLRAECDLRSLSLPSVPARISADGPTALLSFFDPVAGSERDRKAVLVDTEQCKTIAEIAIPGIAIAIRPVRDGWVAVVSKDEMMSPDVDLVLLDTHGVRSKFDITEQLRDLEKSMPRTGRGLRVVPHPIPVGPDVWVVPSWRYELWRPAQHARPFRKIVPPDCLRAEGRLLDPDEREAWLAGHGSSFRAEGPGNRHKTSDSGFVAVAATTGEVSRGWSLAVSVRDSRFEGGIRVDIWDMMREVPTAVLPFPKDGRLLGLGQDVLWYTTSDNVVRAMALPDAAAEVDPCDAVANALAAEPRARATPPPSQTPAPTGAFGISDPRRPGPP